MKTHGFAVVLGGLCLIALGCDQSAPVTSNNQQVQSQRAGKGAPPNVTEMDDLEAERRGTAGPATSPSADPVAKLPVRESPLPQDPFAAQTLPGLPGGNLPLPAITPAAPASREPSAPHRDK